MSATFDNYIGGEWVGGTNTAANRNPSDLADVIGEYAWPTPSRLAPRLPPLSERLRSGR